jgi:hypothetical protein
MKNETEYAYVNCGCTIFIVVLNLLVGGWSVNYILTFFLDKAIPFFWATVIGLFAGEITIPVAVIVAILHYFGII